MSQSSSERPGNRGATEGLSESERYRLLAAERRRNALAVLSEWSTPVHLEELSTILAREEDGADRPHDRHVQEVAIALHHVHLPKIADVGVIEYDHSRNRIESTSVPDDLVVR